MIFALAPAWRLSQVAVMGELKEQTGGELSGSGGRKLFSLRNVLVVGQLALSLTLLTVAGLFARGAMAAAKANPGFSLDQRLLVEADASLAGYNESQGRQVYLSLLERLRALPGVQAASVSYLVPFGLFSDGREVQAAGPGSAGVAGEGAQTPPKHYASFNIVANDYFKTLGIPLLRGREFSNLEVSTASAAPVAIIDEPLAQRLWPGEEAVGRHLQFVGKAAALLVVGVVAGIRDQMDNKSLEPHVYIPYGQEYRAAANLHVRVDARSADTEQALLKTLQETVRAHDPRLAVLSVQTLRQYHEEGLLVWIIKTLARLFTAFGGMALFLAVVGIYAVKSYVVARRTREIGIRLALGATRQDVLWMILRQGLILIGVGAALGLLLALAAGFGVRSLLYGVAAVDPLAFTVGPASLVLAALLACYAPARRATNVQPMASLRYE
jgi:predicted permease